MAWPSLEVRLSSMAGGDGLIAPFSPSVAAAVVERDGHRCRFCGLRSLRYQSVVCIDENPADINALVCACIFCEQVTMLDRVARMHSGVFILLPEIEQTRLHRIAVECYVARVCGDRQLSDAARRVLDGFLRRRPGAQQRIGSDEPDVIAKQLASAEGEGLKQLRALMRDLRLFPLDRRISQQLGMEYNQFPQILSAWRSSAGPYPPKSALPFLWEISQSPIRDAVPASA